MLDAVDRVEVVAPPGCEDAARNFYGRLLALAELDTPEALRGRGGVWLRARAQQLHVGVEMDFRPARKAHPAVTVRACDELLERLRAAGAEPEDDDSIPAVRRYFLADPGNNRIELFALENGS